MSIHNVLDEMALAKWLLPDPGDAGAIRPARSAMVNLTTVGGAQTRTLPNPVKEGMLLVLVFTVDGGDCVVTAATALNKAGNTILTFDDARDTVVLMSVPAPSGYRWQIIGSDDVTAS